MAIRYLLFRIQLIIFNLLQPFFKKDGYLLFDSLMDSAVECIDAYSFFTWLQSKGIRSCYVLWASNPLYKKLKTENKLTDIIVLKGRSPKLSFLSGVFCFLLRTKTIVTAFGGLQPFLNKYLYSNKYIRLVHIGHGVTMFKTSVFKTEYLSPGKHNNSLVTSDMEEGIFVENGWDKNNLIKSALPRWDLLKKNRLVQTGQTGQTGQKTIFMLFTWRHSFRSQYARETGFDVVTSLYVTHINAMLSAPELQYICKQKGISLKIALHHTLFQKTDKLPDFQGAEQVDSHAISHYVKTADLFVTDYSSLAFDFLFLNTPVVFYRPDFGASGLHQHDLEDMKNAGQYDSLLFNIHYDIPSALDNIVYYIDNNFILEKSKADKCARFFYIKNNIREHFYNQLESISVK